MLQKKIRVFQFATGNVGSEMVGRIVNHPDLVYAELPIASGVIVATKRRT